VQAELVALGILHCVGDWATVIRHPELPGAQRFEFGDALEFVLVGDANIQMYT